MNRVTKFKVDIFSLNDLISPASERKYFTSISGHTERDGQWLTGLLQYLGTKSLVEGVEIIGYSFDNYVLYEVTGLLFDGELFKNALYNSPYLTITNESIENIAFSFHEDVSFLIIGNDTTVDQISDYNLDFLKPYAPYFIKKQTIFEWGASAFWEEYIISVTSDMTAKLLQKLKAVDFPKAAIKQCRLPVESLNEISLYNLSAKNIFLQSYNKKGKCENVILRSANYRFYIETKNEVLSGFIVEGLERYA